MSQHLTIRVSDEVARYAAQVAAHTTQSIEEVIAAWLEAVAVEVPVEQLDDSQLLQTANMQLSSERQAALSDLLARNREASLSAHERQHLDELMRTYEQGLLRKSQAMREAVKRNLLAPLSA